MARVIYVKKPTISNVVKRACKHCGNEFSRGYRGDFCCRKCAEEHEYYSTHIDMRLMKQNKRLALV